VSRQVLLLEAGGEQPTKSRIPWFSVWLAGEDEIALENAREKSQKVVFIDFTSCEEYV
jgi:hypothetical protein